MIDVFSGVDTVTCRGVCLVSDIFDRVQVKLVVSSRTEA